jgi:molybdate transport system substrate-binding protein
MPDTPRHTTRALLALAALACASCERAEAPATLEVFAASSLAEAFADLEQGFERDHPGVDVRVTLAGSQVLRLQIEQGAGADVFASADEAHMRALVEAGQVEGAEELARNALVVIVPEASKAQGFASLGDAERVVVGTETSPIGRYTRQMLDRARGARGAAFVDGVWGRVVSQEPNARLVRAKVALGEADAAVVYRTDALGARGVRVIEVPEGVNVQASYPIGVVSGAARGELARRFVAYARSERGARVLRARGFVVGGR